MLSSKLYRCLIMQLVIANYFEYNRGRNQDEILIFFLYGIYGVFACKLYIIFLLNRNDSYVQVR